MRFLLEAGLGDEEKGRFRGRDNSLRWRGGILVSWGSVECGKEWGEQSVYGKMKPQDRYRGQKGGQG